MQSAKHHNSTSTVQTGKQNKAVNKQVTRATKADKWSHSAGRWNRMPGCEGKAPVRSLSAERGKRGGAGKEQGTEE